MEIMASSDYDVLPAWFLKVQKTASPAAETNNIPKAITIGLSVKNMYLQIC